MMSDVSQRTDFWQPPVWLGFLWGFAEGTLFFIIPDVLLSWAALISMRNGAKQLASITTGALFAGFLMYSWATVAPQQSQTAVASTPFVCNHMFQKVEQDYQMHGLVGMLYGPSSGIPYKVYTVLAPSQNSFLMFILLSIPARLERLALSWLVFTAIGWGLRCWISKHPRTTTLLFIAFWTATYAVYWSSILCAT